MEQALAATIAVDPARVDDLARARADAVVRALTAGSGIAPERITAEVGSEQVDGPPRVVFELE